jgi:Lar family restriction alleviation protein
MKPEPCPFCGTKPREGAYPTYNEDTGKSGYSVWCMRRWCNFGGPTRYSQHDAIEAWNRRAGRGECDGKI